MLLPMPPKVVRMLAGIVTATILISALAMIVLAIAVPPKPAWTLMAFEVVIAVSCGVILPFSRGAYREGPGLALLCASGAILVGSVMGYLSLHGVMGTHSLKMWVAARAALAMLLGLCAAATVLVRTPKSWGVLIKGLLCAVPPVVVAALFVLGKAGPLAHARQGLSEAIRIAIVLIIAIAVGGLFCAAVHLIIRAFEMCRGPGESASPPASASSKSAASA